MAPHPSAEIDDDSLPPEARDRYAPIVQEPLVLSPRSLQEMIGAGSTAVAVFQIVASGAFVWLLLSGRAWSVFWNLWLCALSLPPLLKKLVERTRWGLPLWYEDERKIIRSMDKSVWSSASEDSDSLRYVGAATVAEKARAFGLSLGTVQVKVLLAVTDSSLLLFQHRRLVERIPLSQVSHYELKSVPLRALQHRSLEQGELTIRFSVLRDSKVLRQPLAEARALRDTLDVLVQRSIAPSGAVSISSPSSSTGAVSLS